MKYLIYTCIAFAAFLSIATKKLTIAGGFVGGVVAALVFSGGGYTCLVMLAVFFTLGVVATGWKSLKKVSLGLAAKHGVRRTAGQVFANGGIAAMLGLIAVIYPTYQPVIQIMIAGSLASATADTLASELGSVYGTTFFEILSLKKVEPGPDGVVSIAGTIIGMFGAIVIATTYMIGINFNVKTISVIVISGVLGNLIDSLLGAMLERKQKLNNNAVNLLNTLSGALLSLALLL